jgi:HEAT repeat protein
MSPLRVVLLISLLAIATHPLPAQTPLNPIPEAVQKACDPNYKPSSEGALSGGPRPFSVLLCERGIDTSEPSLIAALSNSDPEVRTLAAYQLAENCDFSDFPAIESALSTEKDTHARIGMASALASSGDRVGARDLEAMCTHASVSVDDTVRVVQQLAMAQRSHPNIASAGKCADVVLAALDSVSESYQRRELVSELPSMVHDVPKDKADRMVMAAQNLLGSKEAATRMSASRALAEMGSSASIELIRDAIQNEPNASIREWHKVSFLTLLPSCFQTAPKDQANHMIADAQNLLTSDSLTMRQAASHALAQMGSTASIELIRNAIQRDKFVPSSMQKDLTTLENLQQPGAPTASANPPH